MVHVAQLPGFEVQVVAPVPYWPPVKMTYRWQYTKVVSKEQIEGVVVHHPRYFMIPKIAMFLHGWFMFLSVLPYMKKLSKIYPFDVIDAHYVYPDGFAGVLLGAYFDRPVIVSARGSDINQFASFPLIRKFLSYTLRRATRVITVCEALKQAVVPLCGPEDKITVIPNGVDSQKFFPIPQPEARQSLDLPDCKIILSVGGLIPRKGFDLLIKSFHKIAEKVDRKNVFLVIIGDGPEHGRLHELVSQLRLTDSVRFSGDVPHSELYRWYSAADLFCLASSREGWPNVVLEAMACGTPVVATAVWGTPEIISSSSVGLLTERNEEDLADALQHGLSKTWDRNQIVHYARNHGWEQVARSVTEVFQGVQV